MTPIKVIQFHAYTKTKSAPTIQGGAVQIKALNAKLKMTTMMMTVNYIALEHPQKITAAFLVMLLTLLARMRKIRARMVQEKVIKATVALIIHV